MKVNRLFYDASVNFKNISSERLVLGFVFGLASSLIIYEFFYVLRESFRVLAFGFEKSPNIVSESNREFYNVFFAALSLIFGNSITINLIFSKPQSILLYRNPKRKRILNDQIFLSFNFSFWFVKLGLLFGAFSMCCMDFEFLPYLKYPSYLLLFVLYLESWKNLSTIFRKVRFKYQLLHLVVMIFLTFILSRLDVINYKAIDASAVKKNPIIDLPYSDFYNSVNENRDFTISYKLLLDENDNLIIINEHFRRFSIEQLANDLDAEKNLRREELVPFISVIISVDKNIKMKYIIEFQDELCKLNQQRIIFAINNNDLSAQRFETRGISFRSCVPYFLNGKLTTNLIIPETEIVPNKESLFESYYNSKNKLKIEIGHVIKVNDTIVSKSKLVDKLKSKINKNTVFDYYYNFDTSYQDYITILAAHFKAVSDLRLNEQKHFDKYENYKAYSEEQDLLKVKYPAMKVERITE